MENITPTALWAIILAVASAIVLLSNAGEKIVKLVKAAKAPNDKQDERIQKLEEWRHRVDEKLNSDNRRLEGIEAGNRATQHALLALLDHGIDGNNIEQMRHAKEELQNHLINR